MNERIKELMGKTLDDKFSHTWDTMTHEGLLQFSEKFAELIVRECILQVADVRIENDFEPVGDAVLVRALAGIKNYFGIAE